MNGHDIHVMMFCRYCGKGLSTFEYNVTEFSNDFECCQYCGNDDPFDGRYCRTDLPEDYLLLPENYMLAKRDVMWWCQGCQRARMDDLEGEGIGCWRVYYCVGCKKDIRHIPVKPGHLLVGGKV